MIDRHTRVPDGSRYAERPEEPHARVPRLRLELQERHAGRLLPRHLEVPRIAIRHLEALHAGSKAE